MILNGLHILLTYQCNFECEHCFVWGSPRQRGTLSLKQLREILRQAKEMDSIEWIYFEGGEPFLFYPVLLAAVREAADSGFKVGIVSNGYWAISPEDALEWLRPFVGLLNNLSVSSDLYHYDELISSQASNAVHAAESLGIDVGMINVAQPERAMQNCPPMQPTTIAEPNETSESRVIYRGRAAEKLATLVRGQEWSKFVKCPYEDLRDPGRIHVDPFGYLHICQGISIGNLFRQSLKKICTDYEAKVHPIAGPLLSGGPVELVKRYALPHADEYADACHLCYAARLALRARFPGTLTPDQMYGDGDG